MHITTDSFELEVLRWRSVFLTIGPLTLYAVRRRDHFMPLWAWDECEWEPDRAGRPTKLHELHARWRRFELELSWRVRDRSSGASAA